MKKPHLDDCNLVDLVTSERQAPACSSKLSVINCKFSKNRHIGDQGGILYVRSASSLLVEATEFSDISSNQDGGHTYAYGCTPATFDRQCTAKTFSEKHGQSSYIASTSQATYTLCSITLSPNNVGGSGAQWFTLYSCAFTKAFQTKINISHCDFPVPNGRGSVIGWYKDGSGAEFGTFADNRLSQLISLKAGKGSISSSNVVNNSEKETFDYSGLFSILPSPSITCTDTLFINNHFARLVYDSGTVSFENSFFFDCSFNESTSIPTANSQPATRALENQQCYWPTPTFFFTPQKALLQEFLESLFLTLPFLIGEISH